LDWIDRRRVRIFAAVHKLLPIGTWPNVAAARQLFSLFFLLFFLPILQLWHLQMPQWEKRTYAANQRSKKKNEVKRPLEKTGVKWKSGKAYQDRCAVGGWSRTT